MSRSRHATPEQPLTYDDASLYHYFRRALQVDLQDCRAGTRHYFDIHRKKWKRCIEALSKSKQPSVSLAEAVVHEPGLLVANIKCLAATMPKAIAIRAPSSSISLGKAQRGRTDFRDALGGGVGGGGGGSMGPGQNRHGVAPNLRILFSSSRNHVLRPKR